MCKPLTNCSSSIRCASDKIGQVVPDNMIVVHSEVLHPEGSYDTAFEPAPPFCVLEYVSNSNKRKDYDDNMRNVPARIESAVLSPLLPRWAGTDAFHHNNKRKYISVKPNEYDRLAISELELEVAIFDGSVTLLVSGQTVAVARRLAVRPRRANATGRRANATGRR